MIRLVFAALGCLVLADGPAPDPSYEQMKATAGRDAAAQVELALWCEAHGLEKERLKHLAVAVLADPSNAMARGLLGLVEYGGKWRRPEAVADAVRADVKHADLLAEYAGRRLRAPIKPDAQYKLALWCEEKGLKDEARAHLATVVRLDPKHADAWKRLGYKKVGNRWVTEARASAEKAERQAQQEADRRWRTRLERLREALDGKGQRKGEAQRELAAVTDPRAVPAVWHVFVERGGNHQVEAVQLLGQIDAIEASRALATLAVSAKSDEVRRRATETLRRRDPREWADLLIAMLREKIKYQVTRVGGPGSPGSLRIAGQGKGANLNRVYAPPPGPSIGPGDTLGYDAFGNLIAQRDLGLVGSPPIWGKSLLPQRSPGTSHYDMPNAFVGAGVLQSSGSPQLARDVIQGSGLTTGQKSFVQGAMPALETGFPGLFPTERALATASNRAMPFGPITRFSFTYRETATIPLGLLQREAEKTAYVAQAQLDADVASLDAVNDQIGRSNDQIAAILSSATGQSFGGDRKAWEKWFVNQVGYAFMTPDDETKPTVVESVPLAYQPQPIPVAVTDRLVGFTRMSCFGRGTPVRTLSGPRPIEDLKVGDLVLAQDIRTGRLGYRPITVVHHNPPSPTYVITAGDDPIVSSHFHRFWVVSRGWVMARDLKEGDPIRTLGGVVKVTKIEPGEVQKVYNLDVESDADFFAGSVAALVHDNTLPDLKQVPFDAPPAVAAK